MSYQTLENRIKVNGSCGIASSGKRYLYLNTDSSISDDLIMCGALSCTMIDRS